MSKSKIFEDDKNMHGNSEFETGSDKEALNRRWHRYLLLRLVMQFQLTPNIHTQVHKQIISSVQAWINIGNRKRWQINNKQKKQFPMA